MGVENKQKIKLHDLQIENLKRFITHSTLTDTEITQLPKDTKVYESVGRMFLLSDIGTVKSGLNNKSEKIHVLNSNKEYLERQIKEQENNLRELITAKKNAN